MQMALFDVTEAVKVCEWCADQCLDEGPGMATCVRPLVEALVGTPLTDLDRLGDVEQGHLHLVCDPFLEPESHGHPLLGRRRLYALCRARWLLSADRGRLTRLFRCAVLSLLCHREFSIR